MNEAIITLRIKYDPQYDNPFKKVLPPDSWNWQDLIDLKPDEEVEVVACSLTMIDNINYEIP